MIDFSLSHKLTDDIVVSNDLVCALQQIDLLFNTSIDDVLGDASFGTNYDKYLYTVGISNSALETKILNDLQQLNLCGFEPSVTVNIVEGTYRDIAFINITLTGAYDNYEKTYVIK